MDRSALAKHRFLSALHLVEGYIAARSALAIGDASSRTPMHPLSFVK